MNKEEAKKAIEVMKAFTEGKKIQFKAKHGELNWRDGGRTDGVVGFNWIDYEYRVKPEKIVIEKFFNIYPNNVIIVHETRMNADRDAGSERLACKRVVFEVEEGEGL